MIEEGGYYAIKGFEYQIDKAILEVLTTSDDHEKINIERIQDINTDDFVMQVKYKERKKFTPSIIKDPVIKLLDEFKICENVDYILYAFFKDLNGYEDFTGEENKITVESLDRILGNRKDEYLLDTKIKFCTRFKLDFSPDFQCQFEKVIELLCGLDFVSYGYDEAVFYYSNISSYIKKLIVNNDELSIENRQLTRNDILILLNNGRKLIFNSSFREYRGDLQYFKLIRSKYFLWKNISNHERFFVVEVLPSVSIFTLKEIVISIVKKCYNKSGSHRKEVIKSGAPYVYFKGLNEVTLVSLKNSLVKENYFFLDGHDYLGSLFSVDSIKKPSTIHNNICLKLVNSSNDFSVLMIENYSRHVIVYDFYLTQPVDFNCNFIKAEVKINKPEEVINVLKG